MTITKIGVVFPGQGSQSVGMLADIAKAYPEVKQTFAEASNALDFDLWKLAEEGPVSELDKTENTQPAILAASIALWRIIQPRIALKPAILAGHSLGEYTALVCANALSFTDAIKLVHARGLYMQNAVDQGEGAMAAIIGLDEKQVTAICDEARSSNEILAPANFNSIGQIVIAGHKQAVERAMTLAKENGAKMAVLIPVSVPSHCELMLPAAKQLANLLADISIQKPQIPVLNNVDVVSYESAASIREGLIRQLSMPVRWVETIQQFSKSGITDVIECGPGKVLTGLIKRIDRNLKLFATADLSSLEIVLKLENERSLS